MSTLWHVLSGLEKRLGRPSRGSGTPTAPATTVQTFTAPVGSPTSSLYTVSAQGTQTCCYASAHALAAYTSEGHFANFAMSNDGYVDVTVVCTNTPATASVHPAKFAITPTIVGNTVTFRINQPHKYVLTLDGDWTKPVWVFANPYVVAPNPASVTHYYGPGYYNGTYPNGAALNTEKRLTLSANESAYFDGGAYFVGKLQMGPMTGDVGPTTPNIHVSGYGVIDSTLVTTGTGPGRAFFVGNLNNSSIQGPTIINHSHWGGIIMESNYFDLDDVKMVSYLDPRTNPPTVPGHLGTPDGIDIMGSSNVNYRNCFIRANDDSIAIKTWKNGFFNARGNVENILVEDCVFQNGDKGNGLEIGYENFNNTTNTATPVTLPGTSTPIQFIRNITYRRCDIVYKDFQPDLNYRAAALGIHLVDDVPLSNVLYEDVNIEYLKNADTWLWLGSFYTGDYSYGNARAQINGVTLRRVNFMDGEFTAYDGQPGKFHIQGGGGAVIFDNLVFEDVYVMGSKVINTATIPGKMQWSIVNTVNMEFI